MLRRHAVWRGRLKLGDAVLWGALEVVHGLRMLRELVVRELVLLRAGLW